MREVDVAIIGGGIVGLAVAYQLSRSHPEQRVLVLETGIVNYRAVCERLAERVRERDGEIRLRTRVTAMHRHSSGMTLHTTTGDVDTRQVVNCAGLHCDRVTALGGQRSQAQIVPF